MISTVVLVLLVAYLALMVLAVCSTSRPERAARLWWAALVLAVVLTALSVAEQQWLTAGLWVLNVGLDALNIHLARGRQRDRETHEMWVKRFQNQP